MSTNIIRPLCIAVALACCATAAPAAATAAAVSPEKSTSANAKHTGCDTGADDFDGNGGTDLAVAGPDVGGDEDESRVYGAVKVLMRHRDGMKRVALPHPKQIDGGSVHSFGTAITELDLSSHKDAAQPCAALAVSARYGQGKQGSSVIFLYRWSRRENGFTVVSTITQAELGGTFTSLGKHLASQTMRSDRPEPRQRVLYASAHETGVGKVVLRLMLSPDGSVVTQQVIAPGATATANMPLTRSVARGGFGDYLLGTPSANQVIISDSYAKTTRGGGAVLVWNKQAKAQLITPASAHVPVSRRHGRTYFGATTYLATEASNHFGGTTYLMIGSPFWSAKHHFAAGGALQLRYQRSVHPANVVLSDHRWWTQASKGVAGKQRYESGFGGSFTTVAVGKRTVIGAGMPAGTANGGASVVVALGTGQSWDARSVGEHDHKNWDGAFGAALSSVHDIDDRLAHDPFPATTRGRWASRVVVAAPDFDYVDIGLPTVTSHTHKVHRFPASCSYESQGCGWGYGMSDSVGS